MSYPRLTKEYVPSTALKSKINSNTIVHIGTGAFHKAHQAVYTDDVNHDGMWQVIGVSLKSAQTRDQLNTQNGLYTVVECDGQSKTSRIITCIKEVLFAPESPQLVIDTLANENTKVISLTVTEKGYSLDTNSGNLDRENPEIVNDIRNLASPKTTVGYLVASLKKRFEENGKAPTIISCDNLTKNGQTLAKLVYQFAELVSADLATWIKDNVRFPNTMVDRIVPATTAHDIELLAEQTGYNDLAMVKTEPYKQWVIENQFCNERPEWESAGALIVDDVTPFENVKLRLLNGSHSALAYLGFLYGYEYVHQVVENKLFKRYVNYLMTNEVTSTLTIPAELDIESYRQDLIKRFANSSLMHKTYQIAMDGSQKLPARILDTIEDRLRQGQSVNCLTFAVAGWLRYSMGFDQKGDRIVVQDPYAQELEAIQKRFFSHIDELIAQYLAFDKVFSKYLRTSEVFRSQLTYYLGLILANGVDVALKTLLLEIEHTPN